IRDFHVTGVQTCALPIFLHALKYKQQPELGEFLGRVYGKDLAEADFMDQFDLVVPVPLHITRRRIRGYNQSETFGRGLADILARSEERRVGKGGRSV